jgi:hypothetical protein
MKQRFLQALLTLGGLTIATLLTSGSASAYTNSRLMDDSIFDNVNSMTEQQIRDFILARPNSCLGKTAPGYGGGAIYPEPITYWQYGGNVDAARVIYNAAHYNDLNPQVIIATLQKEQSLFTDTDCLDQNGVARLPKAMGQGCPDGGACPAPAYAGFHQQVMKGAWQLKFNKERAVGNVEWGDNGSIVYPEPYTEGNRKNCSTCAVIYRDGYKSIDGQMIKMETGATASFYRYTPHLGQALPGIFEGWFGSTLIPNYSAAYAGQSGYPTVVAGNTAAASLSYKNVGDQIWYDDTSIGTAPAGKYAVHLATGQPNNRVSPFGATWAAGHNRPGLNFSAVYEADGTTLAANQHVATVGQIVKFNFTFTVPINQPGGVYREFFQPVAEGTGNGAFATVGTYLDVTVQAASFGAQYAGQSSYPTMFSGGTDNAYLNYKNTGNQLWYDDTSVGTAPVATYPVHLSTGQPTNRVSSFGATWAAGHNRPGLNFSAVYEADGTTPAANQHVVAVGQIARFAFPFNSPANQAPGVYREFFQPVAEGTPTGAFPFVGTYLDATVQARTFTAQYAGQSNYPTIARGGSAAGFVKLKNTGNQIWYDDNSIGGAPAGSYPVHLSTGNPNNRVSPFGATWAAGHNRPALTFGAVYESDGTTLAANQHAANPGQIVQFNFTFSVSASQAVGKYREFFQPVAEGTPTGAFPFVGVYLDVTVQ